MPTSKKFWDLVLKLSREYAYSFINILNAWSHILWSLILLTAVPGPVKYVQASTEAGRLLMGSNQADHV